MRSKKITKAGGITIPKQFRSELGIFSGHVVDVEVVNDSIVLTKHISTCKLCGTNENVINYKELEVCKKCIENMQEVANG